MARQRVGQSLRFKLLVAIATVVLCFLHLPINASQTLAVSSGREATRGNLEKLTVRELKTKLRKKGLKVSGRKADLVERLVKMTRRIPKAEEPAIFDADVFIPLNETIGKLEVLLREERVVFLRAGVACGKSTLAQHLCSVQPSKYLQVYPPDLDNLTSHNWRIEFMAALRKVHSTRDVANRNMRDAIKNIHDNDQVLVFDECHLLFACPQFYQQFLKKPPYLERRPMVLLLSAASEMQSVQGQTFITPSEITAKYMWKPPMPDAKELADQLAGADVYLSEDAVHFFLQICGGHRGIFMKAMEWVQKRQKSANKKWTVEQAYGQVKRTWENGDWGDPDSFLGTLATVRAIHVNGNYADLAKIPPKFLEILCGGATSNLELEDCRHLTIHGFLLPVAAESDTEEFLHYNWNAQGARYGVSSHLLASYYRYVLEKKRELEVDVNRNASSCTDLLLRALPYLHFAKVVDGVILQNKQVQAAFSAEGLPSEVHHYTRAIIQILQRWRFSATSVETGNGGKVDIYILQDDSCTFAIEAVMAARETAVVEQHRNRFDRMTAYKDAKHKCLLIIGREGSQLRRLVRDTRGGIEIVGLAANAAHTGYRVYKRQGEKVLNFSIPCDGVARSVSFMDEEPFYKVSSAQKFKNIRAGATETQTKAVWVRQLRQDDTRGFEFAGNAFQVKEKDILNIDDLKKAIKKEKPNKVLCDPDEIDIYSREDGRWKKVEKMGARLQDTDDDNPYGYILP